ncbi:MAG TPA: (d)CMP kinase [Lachnospiraceae bacterium]|nr:(d)CMP kinase [Lachnospiraceae bacterium]
MAFAIAIDGPAGAGKSTIAKIVAKKMGAIYVDTGAMYRAIALYLIRAGISADDKEGIEKSCDDASVSIEYKDGAQIVILNGENVNDYLRSEEVGNMASKSSANGKVREKLVSLQRELAKTKDVVMDGRDIGTVVLPSADLKIYLTASAKTRAQRRAKELIEKGEEADINIIEKEIIERDERDMTREISPLKKADDAIEIDSSDMSIEEVTDKIISLAGKE